jgi:hypothetical protein
MSPIEDSVSVNTLQRSKECFRRWLGITGGLQVIWKHGFALRSIDSFPAFLDIGLLNLSKSRSGHPFNSYKLYGGVQLICNHWFLGQRRVERMS